MTAVNAAARRIAGPGVEQRPRPAVARERNGFWRTNWRLVAGVLFVLSPRIDWGRRGVHRAVVSQRARVPGVARCVRLNRCRADRVASEIAEAVITAGKRGQRSRRRAGPHSSTVDGFLERLDVRASLLIALASSPLIDTVNGICKRVR
jgi:hypothetical protein